MLALCPPLRVPQWHQALQKKNVVSCQKRDVFATAPPGPPKGLNRVNPCNRATDSTWNLFVILILSVLPLVSSWWMLCPFDLFAASFRPHRDRLRQRELRAQGLFTNHRCIPVAFQLGICLQYFSHRCPPQAPPPAAAVAAAASATPAKLRSFPIIAVTDSMQCKFQMKAVMCRAVVN